MEKTFTEQTQKTLEEKFSSFQALKDREQELRGRLRRAEEERDTVSEKIYLKVKAEYKKQLSNISAEMTPMVGEIAETREATVKEFETIEAELTAIEEEHTEAVFRHRVGEYDQAKLKEIEDSILPRIEEKRSQKEPLAGLLEKIDEAVKGISEEPEPTDPPAKEVAVSDVTDTDIEHDPPPFELESEEEKAVDDFISELADPVKETSVTDLADKKLPPQKEPAPATDETLIPFPNLIIITGNQAGKKIPLLPMTMTIGREHDNNIELKDEEIARYHARVLYQDNQFMLEDMESSTGTWVNNDKITKVALKNSDKIRFGNTDLVIDFS